VDIFDLVRDLFGRHIPVVRFLVRNCFGSHIALVRHGSGSFDVSSLWCICRSTGRPSYARQTYRLRSQGALAGSPPGVLVDSSVRVFATT
jgi:hypothetical protein